MQTAKRCPDEIEAARDVQSSLVKELCLWIRVNRDQLRLERIQDLQPKLTFLISSGHELR